MGLQIKLTKPFFLKPFMKNSNLAVFSLFRKKPTLEEKKVEMQDMRFKSSGCIKIHYIIIYVIVHYLYIGINLKQSRNKNNYKLLSCFEHDEFTYFLDAFYPQILAQQPSGSF